MKENDNDCRGVSHRWAIRRQTMKILKSKSFGNGIVYALETEDGFPIEVTDTFLPFYTKNAINQKQNNLIDSNFGDRSERYLIGVSCMSGCNVGCAFCATGKLKKFRSLTAKEIVDQVEFVISQNPNFPFAKAKEHKINYTRMGEPFLNIEAVKEAIKIIDEKYPGTHHYISTIGIKGADFSFIKNNITLQLSLHSLNEERRNKLIPIKKKMMIEELGKVRTSSNLKTTINLTLVDENDFDIEELKKNFDPKSFFIKMSPINPNSISDENKMGTGVIDGINIV
jgi:23S rRNA (adenine2503-C2)-methyltransferase